MSERPLDLDPVSRDALELDALLEAVAEHARTSLGRLEILGLTPSGDPAEVARRIDGVREAAQFLAVRGKVIAGAVPDPREALERIALDGARAEPAQLRDLANLAEAASQARFAVLQACAEQPYPRLQQIVEPVADLSFLAAGVLGAIGPDGRVLDGASPELARIRRELARVGERLRRLLEVVLRAEPQRTGVQDSFVTQRNGRFVVPVRADAHAKIRGIVHASSSSGATLFVEPFESVELNNELVRLAEDERDEELRVLADWSARLRVRIGDLRRAADALAALDGLQARVLWGQATGGSLAEISADGRLELVLARHPLLDLRLRTAGSECIPFSVALGSGDRALVVSGPNAGGKTVVLKTIGLAAIQAATAIPIPARRAVVPLYAAIRADIGDHQSLEDDLSTFSAHLAAIRAFLERARPPALMLFDEIGTGTDPAEGAALAQAVLERSLDLGVTAVATTHHGSVKAWAFTTPSVVSAALEFDDATLRPTYRVRQGEAGVSAGIEIAERLGLDGAVVSRAREILGEGGGRAESYLRRLREAADALDAERSAVESERAQAARDRAEVRALVAAEIERVRAEGAREIDRLTRELREAARRESEAIEDEVRREIARRERRRADSRLRASAEAAKRELRIGGVPSSPSGGPGAPPWAAEPGFDAWVRSLGRQGEIVARRGARADVRFGAVTFTVDVADLAAPVDSTGAAAPAKARPSRSPAGDLERDAPAELHLLGRSVEEALPEVDRFLNGAVLAGRDEVRVIHGHGTGRLRAGIRTYLRTHPLVVSLRPGGPGEGGDGATVVTLSAR